MTGLALTILRERLAIIRLDATAAIPAWAGAGALQSVTRTADELSIVCAQTAVPPAATAERGWRAVQVRGPLDFALTGVLAALAQPLAEAEISIFALSTYDTDYVLVREPDLPRARAVLAQAGHTFADVPSEA